MNHIHKLIIIKYILLLPRIWTRDQTFDITFNFVKTMHHTILNEKQRVSICMYVQETKISIKRTKENY